MSIDASTVYTFTSRYPDSWVFATGSTRVRTRLYRIGLTNNLAEISEDFQVFGLRDDNWEEFMIIAQSKTKTLDIITNDSQIGIYFE